MWKSWLCQRRSLLLPDMFVTILYSQTKSRLSIMHVYLSLISSQLFFSCHVLCFVFLHLWPCSNLDSSSPRLVRCHSKGSCLKRLRKTRWKPIVNWALPQCNFFHDTSENSSVRSWLMARWICLVYSIIWKGQTSSAGFRNHAYTSSCVCMLILNQTTGLTILSCPLQVLHILWGFICKPTADWELAGPSYDII